MNKRLIQSILASVRGELYGFLRSFAPGYFRDPWRVMRSARTYLATDFMTRASYAARDCHFLPEQQHALNIIDERLDTIPMGKAVLR